MLLSVEFFENEGKTLMPLFITRRHADADGWRIARFLERWQAGGGRFRAIFIKKYKREESLLGGQRRLPLAPARKSYG